MIQRRTQSASYWQEQFSITQKDMSFLYGLILDAAKPVDAAALSKALIDRHCRQEEELIQAELNKGRVYQPQDTYEVGEPIIFPVFDYALATVVGTRQGKNPEYGEFTVIQVEFEEDGEVREFASQLVGEHRLNRNDGDQEVVTPEDLMDAPELYDLYGVQVEDKLLASLEKHDDFIEVRGEWFLKDLLAGVDLGLRNIAEALIEIKSMPLPPAEILSQLDLPREIPEVVRAFSLNYALAQDPRFDNVGDQGRDIWYLKRLTPNEVVDPPERLAIDRVPYRRQDIAEELLLIEREIDDEGSGEDVMGPSRPLYRTTISLIYPHWRCGTLPLTVRTRGLFPPSENHHTPVILVDGQSGDKMQGWVVHGESFVYGLAEWYERYELPVGTYVKLERTRDPRVINVDFEARRLKRLWGKVAVAQGNNLVFQVRKLPVSCEYDDQLTIAEDNPRMIDRIWDQAHTRGDSLLQIMQRVLPELIKLSPQATVHAKAIYSAANVLKRVPPGPIFALLSTEPCFVAMGGGYWTFDETLVGVSGA